MQLEDLMYRLTLLEHQNMNKHSLYHLRIIKNMIFLLKYYYILLIFFLGKLLTNIKYVGMPNVLLNEEAAPELLQNDCNPNAITSYIIKYLTDKEYYTKISSNLLRVRDTLGEKNVLERVAKEIIES